MIELMKNAVEVKNLTVKYGGKFVALDDVSLNVSRGKITGLIGPSGSGKSTLIESIVGRLATKKGEITVLENAAGAKKLREKVAYMPQEAAVFSDLSVEQNLRFFAKMNGIFFAKNRKRVEEILRTIDLIAKRKSLVSDLSGGQKQRVSLGVALLAKPELLILDEPTVGLDPVLVENLWRIFREISESGATILISSHSMAEAARCDDLVLVRAGKIVAKETPAEILRETGTKNVEQAFLKLVGTEENTDEFSRKNILKQIPNDKKDAQNFREKEDER